MVKPERTFEEDLKDAVAYHGHLCAGQILGVRMARLACSMLGLAAPRSYRDLIVFVENDRCLSDAVSVVTGCLSGRRRLKHKDYGKSAASFLDISNGKAFRVSSRSWQKIPEGEDPLEFLNRIPDGELFKTEEVKIEVPPEDLPGKPSGKAQCSKCGEIITDRREVVKDSQVLCKACAGTPYYTVI